MASNYQYQLTQRAADDLEGIVDYLVQERASPSAAARFLDALERAIQEACSFPESGAKVLNDYLPDTSVRKKVVHNHVLYYLPDSQAQVIQVLRIVYGRRDMNEIFKQLGE